MEGWGRIGWDAWRGDRSGEWQVAGSAARRPFSQVAGSAASRSVQPRDMQWWSDDVHPGLRYFDTEHIQDMDQDEQEEAKTTSRRVEKLGKAFQNYRRAILNILQTLIIKKSYFVAWRHEDPANMALSDLLWTEDDMNHFSADGGILRHTQGHVVAEA